MSDWSLTDRRGFLAGATAGLASLALGGNAQAQEAGKKAGAKPGQAPAGQGAPPAPGQTAPGQSAPAPAPGQANPPPAGPLTGKVACVDVIHVLNEYQRQKDLLDEIRKYSEKLQGEDDRRKQEIDRLDAELSRMDPNDRTILPRSRQLLQQNIEYKNWQDFKRMDTAREMGLWSVQIYHDVVQAVEAIARRDGYDLVFYKGEFERTVDPDAIKEQIRGLHLLYNHPALDITQAVLDKLNGDYRASPRRQMLMQE